MTLSIQSSSSSSSSSSSPLLHLNVIVYIFFHFLFFFVLYLRPAANRNSVTLVVVVVVVVESVPLIGNNQPVVDCQLAFTRSITEALALSLAWETALVSLTSKQLQTALIITFVCVCVYVYAQMCKCQAKLKKGTVFKATIYWEERKEKRPGDRCTPAVI